MQAIVRSPAALRDDQKHGRRFGFIRGRAYLIGYFEFAYTKPQHGRPDLIFFDVKLEPAYWNISSQVAERHVDIDSADRCRLFGLVRR